MPDFSLSYKPLTVEDAFKEFYVVPDYQREYVWESKNVEDLLSDLLSSYNADKDKAYFLGSIVTCKDNSKYELIDGQQRMTTFFILLCIIKHIYSKNGGSNGLIDSLIFSPAREGVEVVNKYHVELQYEDASNYLEIIEKGEPKPKQLTRSGKLLFNTAEIITAFLTENFKEFGELNEFVLAFLLPKTSFIRIETTDISDALKIFETINQRGKSLNPMDLMKNLIFRQVNREKFHKLNSEWKAITDTLEKVDEKPLRFLRYFIMANYDVSSEKDGILREDKIYEWLINNNTQCRYKEEPNKFVAKLKANAELYAQYRKPVDEINGNIHLKNIPLLAGSSYRIHLVLMLAAQNMNADALANFKSVLEAIVYYTIIGNVPAKDTERYFTSWCSEIRQIVTVSDLNGFLESTVIPKIDEWKKDCKQHFMLIGLGSLQKYRIKFILCRITAYVDSMRLGLSAAVNLDNYTNNIEIEHIMPQTCEDISVYEVTDEEYGVLLDRLGNLTLLEKTINDSVSNKSYAEKSPEYAKSKFYLTASISQLVNQGQNTAINRTNELLSCWDKWTKQSIVERQEMLYELSERIWNIKPFEIH